MYPHGRPHRSQVRRPAKVEPLEGRSLLGALVPSSTSAQADEQVAIHVPSAYISDRVGTLDVTLQRSAQPGGPGAAAAAQAQTLLAQPLTVELSIGVPPPNVGPDPIGGPVPASRQAALALAKRTLAALRASGKLPPAGSSLLPVAVTPQFLQSATFPAGIASISVPVPLAELASPTGNTQLGLNIHGGGPQVYGMNQQIEVVSGPDAIPPTITDVHTIQKGHKITGISITFSEAMDPASIQDVRDYRLTPNSGAHPRVTALKSAQYDPATDTVILTTRGPLNPSGTYQIGAAMSIGSNAAEGMMDLQGNALNETFGGAGGVPRAFSITVGAKHPYSAAALVLWGGS
jgi:Bacterial Ig-like domain